MKMIPAIPALREWLIERDLSNNQFARENKIDQSDFHKIMHGRRLKVNVEFAFKVQDGTGGDIDARLWVPVEVEVKGEGARA